MLQRDALDEVSYDKDLLWSVDKVVQFDNAGVLQALEDCDFALGRLALHRICQLVLVVDLHRILLLVAFVQAQTHCCVGSLSNYSTYMIAFELPTGLGTCRHMALMDGLVHPEHVSLSLVAEAISVGCRATCWHRLAGPRQCSSRVLLLIAQDVGPPTVVRPIERLYPVWVVLATLGRWWGRRIRVGSGPCAFLGRGVVPDKDVRGIGGRCSCWHAKVERCIALKADVARVSGAVSCNEGTIERIFLLSCLLVFFRSAHFIKVHVPGECLTMAPGDVMRNA